IAQCGPGPMPASSSTRYPASGPMCRSPGGLLRERSSVVNRISRIPHVKCATTPPSHPCPRVDILALPTCATLAARGLRALSRRLLSGLPKSSSAPSAYALISRHLRLLHDASLPDVDNGRLDPITPRPRRTRDALTVRDGVRRQPERRSLGE